MTDSSSRPHALGPLVGALDGARIAGDLDRTVFSIAHDSRAVRPGTLFVALRGERVDGHAYVETAIASGACAVVVDERYAAEHPVLAGAPTVIVAQTRAALSRLSAVFFDYPAATLPVIGVTGTNGKTTTTHLIVALLEAGGIAAGRIGTLGARLAGAHWSLDNTTPLALELQKLLAAMRDRGARAVALEVSSHALALERVADVDFAYAVLTNVTRDHLDFHKTFDAYAAAKRSLFERAHVALLNLDDAYGRRWAADLRAANRRVRTYGDSMDADVRAENVRLRADGADFVVAGTRFALRLPGRFNIANALAALCIAREFGVSDATSAAALADFERVPGRMEHIAGDGFDVFVDYAHTPDALDVVLRAARETVRGQLIIVFGCGGDRDRGKRPEMGAIASALADGVVVTSDNPRREAPQAIVDDILAGIADPSHVQVEIDRRAAIAGAIARARPGDVVVVAGKGHETYQIVGETTQHFDDRAEVRAALSARAAVGA